MMSKALRLFILTAWVLALPAVSQSQTFDDYLASAQQEMDVWNHEEAVGFLDQALALDQSRPEVYLMRAMAKRDTGDHDGALQDFDSAFALNPNMPECLYERGMLRYYVQDYQGAVEDFDALLVLEPTEEGILKIRGEAKYQLDDFDGAVADYTAALARSPENPELYYLRAFVRADQEDWDGAVADFTAVMEMEPIAGSLFDKQEVSLLRRAHVKVRAGDGEGALVDCEQALARNAQDLQANFIRGTARRSLQQFAAAIEDFDLVIERYPLPEAFQERGLAKQGLGDESGAAADFAKAAELGYQEP